MRSVDERLHNVNSKIERSKIHIRYLERAVRQFFKTSPYKVGTKRDLKTRKPFYYLSSIDPVPDYLALIAGDAIQNLMSALDHLAYELVGSDTSDRHPNPDWIYFPIGKDPTDFEARLKGKMKGILQATADAVRALKPYRGGNNLLWSLYRLNNIEKHRLLITVGSSFNSFDFGAIISANWKKAFPERHIDPVKLFLMPADRLFPLKVGDKLFFDAADAEVNPQMQFRFEVALNEPGVIEGKPLIETVHQFTNLVEGIVTALTPRLK